MVENKPQKCIIHGKHSEIFPQKDMISTILYTDNSNNNLFLYLDSSIEYKNKKYNCAVATIRSKLYSRLSYNITFFYIDSDFEVCEEKISELSKSWRGGLADIAGISFLE